MKYTVFKKIVMFFCLTLLPSTYFCYCFDTKCLCLSSYSMSQKHLGLTVNVKPNVVEVIKI